MKVLIVSNMYPDEKHPSAGIFVKHFCNELKKINIEYDLSVMLKHNSKIGKIYGYSSFYLLTFIRILLKKYDIVYVHYASHSSVPVLFARRLKKFRIFTNVHGSDVVPENNRQRKFQKYTYQVLMKSEKIIVPSEYFREYVSKKYDLDLNKVTVYPSCGVDRDIFMKLNSTKILDLKNKYHLDARKKTFGYVGRISEKKGWNTYLLAISNLKKLGYDANFLVVGDGVEIGKYEKMVNQLELSNSIIKLSLLTQDELVEVYNSIDTLVFPTEREGESLGLVAIEAMACDTPVIASDYAAPKFYVHNGYNGFKYKVGDNNELTKIMLGFITGKYKKEEFEEGVEKTAEEYSDFNIIQILRNIFR